LSELGSLLQSVADLRIVHVSANNVSLQELTYKYNVAGKWHLAHSDAAAADMQVRAAGWLAGLHVMYTGSSSTLRQLRWIQQQQQ